MEILTIGNIRKFAMRHLVVLLMLAGIVMSVNATPSPDTNAPDSVFYGQYSYIIILNDGEQPREISDEEFFDWSAKIIFPVNQTQLPASNALLRELEQTIFPHINNDSLRLVSMVFRGAASPEGPLAVNERLGKQRVQALYEYVVAHISGNQPDTSAPDGSAVSPAPFAVTINADIEDYRSLCIMMRRAGDVDYAVVKSLCDMYLPTHDLAQLKTKLQQADGGQLWDRLLHEYFPQLRAARFIIYLQKIKPVIPEPQELQVELVEPVKPIEPTEPISPISTISPIPTPTPTVTIDTLYRRELLSIKTNLLFYGAYIPGYDRWCPIPNIAIEYYPLRGHFTFGASFDCPWWQNYEKHKYFQIRNYQIETRYYLQAAKEPDGAYETYKAPAYRGLYLQGYAHLGLFGICFDADRGWVGEGIGAGVGIGYVMPISRNGHWRLEFGLQAGWYGCKYDPYQYENPVNPDYRDHLYYYKWTQDPSLFKKRQYRWNWFGPTRVGITLTYDLLYRRIQKRGISFKSREVYNPYEANEPYKANTLY